MSYRPGLQGWEQRAVTKAIEILGENKLLPERYQEEYTTPEEGYRGMHEKTKKGGPYRGSHSTVRRLCALMLRTGFPLGDDATPPIVPSFPEIARAVGCYSHASIIKSIRKEEAQETIRELRRRIESYKREQLEKRVSKEREPHRAIRDSETPVPQHSNLKNATIHPKNSAINQLQEYDAQR